MAVCSDSATHPHQAPPSVEELLKAALASPPLSALPPTFMRSPASPLPACHHGKWKPTELMIVQRYN
jgi:hypothetical protein